VILPGMPAETSLPDSRRYAIDSHRGMRTSGRGRKQGVLLPQQGLANCYMLYALGHMNVCCIVSYTNDTLTSSARA
jgi:hypothetical protein